MGNPLITIGIPFKDPGLLLEYAIKSVYAQTIQDWELILINDGSNDKSMEFVNKIKDPRIKIIDDGKNLGLPARLNQIIYMAKGKFIARMDADDMMHPLRLEEQLKMFERFPDLDIVDTAAYILNKKREVVGLSGIEEKDMKNRIVALKWGVVLHPSILAKTSWYKNNLYSLDYSRAEDRELFIRTIEYTNLYHLTKPLYFYFFDDNVRLQPYLQSYSSERKVLLKYGPHLIGRSNTIYLYLRSLMKSYVIRGMALVGKQNNINKNKYKPINFDQILEAKKIIDFIENQNLPGFEMNN